MDIASTAASLLSAKNGVARQEMAYKVAEQSVEQQKALLEVISGSGGSAASGGSGGAVAAASAAIEGELGQLLDTVA